MAVKDPRQAARRTVRRPRCLLSLDGGGIRGISSIIILKEIMRQVNKGRPSREHLEPWQVFDLIGGTSTGGIIAIMIGCLRMSLDDCEKAYVTMAEQIFQPKRSSLNPKRFVDYIQARERFSSRSMEKVLKDIIGSQTGNQNTKLMGTEQNDPACKVFVTTVCANNQELCLLRNYDNPYQSAPGAEEWEIWEALRATSAANTYFKHHQKGNFEYLDGAIKGNNPIYQVMMEAEELWDEPEAIMVSIGTGEKTLAPIQGNIIKLAQTLTKTLINPGDTDRKFRRDYRVMDDRDLVYRFSVPKLGHVKLEDYKSMRTVIEDTELFVREASMMDYLQRCSGKVKEFTTTDGSGQGVSGSRGLLSLTREEKEYLQLLHANAGDYDSQRISIDKAVPGTCEWFMKHHMFSEWLAGKSSSLLWVTANPGCGKSVLSSFLVDTLQRAAPDAIICSFFFKTGEQNRSESYQALCALLHQLLRKFPKAARVIPGAFSGKDFGLVTRNVEELWTILKAVLKEMNTQPVVFIVDALDECCEASRHRFIDLLSSAFREVNPGEELPKSFKVMATSRPWSSIEQRFKDLNTIRLRGEDETQIAKDIEAMVKYKVAELSDGGMLSAEARVLIEEKLLSGADQTFLWVSLVFEKIANLHSRTLKSIRKALASIPNNLNQLYESALSQFQAREESIKLLRLVTVAKSPLYLDEINVVMNIDSETQSLDSLRQGLEPNMEFAAKQLGGFFIRIIDSKIHLVHQTAREFLLGTYSNGLVELRTAPVSTEHGEVELAEACIRFLTLDGVPQRTSLPAEKDDLRTLNRQYLSGLPDWSRRFYSYAAINWGATSGAGIAAANNNQIKNQVVLLCSTQGKLFNAWWCFYAIEKIPNWTTEESWGPYFWHNNPYFTHLTTTRGHLVITNTLIETGSCAIADIDPAGWDILNLAAFYGRWKHVEHFLKHYPFSDAQRGSALLAAIVNGNLDILHALVGTGVQLNAPFEFQGRKTTPGEKAALRPVLLQILLDNGLVVVDRHLVMAAGCGNPKSLELLLLHDTRDDCMKKTTLRKALTAAAAEGYMNCYDLILQHTPDLIAEKPDLSVGLEPALVRGDVENLTKLLERGVDASGVLKKASQIYDTPSTTLLLQANDYSKAQLNEALAAFFDLHTGPDLEAYAMTTMRRVLTSKDRSIRLHNAFKLVPSFNHMVPYTNLYLDRGAKIPTASFIRATSLAIALDETLAKFLLDNINTLQESSIRARDFLPIACLWGHEGVIEAIISHHEADINKKGSQGMSPILAAVASGNFEAVALLLGKGAKPSEVLSCSTPDAGDSASLALTKFPAQFIECFGGNVEESPFSLARRLGYGDIEKLLETTGQC
ncbi:Fc.00g092350.m01.CDS01 [Cosmosporella sp. VM-42]